jgi:chromosome segregation ATPase
MDEYKDIVSALGYLIVFGGGGYAIIQSARGRINATTASTITGISELIGVFCLLGNRITEIDTPMGTIKAAETDAKNLVGNITSLQTEAKSQSNELSKIKDESDSIIKEMNINLAEIQKNKEAIPVLMKIIFNDQKIKNKETLLSINNSPEYKALYNPNTQKALENSIESLKNEQTGLNKQLEKYGITTTSGWSIQQY